MSGLHSCKDCGVNFDSGKSLDVHLHYHKENLMSKWIQQATTSSEDNNNVKKNGRPSSSVQPADSSESYYSYQQESGGLLYGAHQENGGVSAFHRIRNFARYHPYQQQAVSSSSASAQCDKCGFVTDNMLEHLQTAHPPHLPPFNFGSAYIKEEAQILDLDSQKVHVYPNGEEPPGRQNDLQQQNQPQQQQQAPPPPPPQQQPQPQHAPWENKFFDEPKKEEQVPSPYHYQNHEEDKDKKLFYEEKRYVLEENGNGSPDFGGVSTTSGSDVMQYYEPMREVSVPKLPPIIKPVGGASWKSNEARRPKTYNCTACNKWFTSSGHLKRHYNTTLHKNAVKQSGVLDPATLPISAHHHPPKEDEKLEPPPAAAPPPPAPFANYQMDHEVYPGVHPEPFHYPQYPNALPPHVTSIGSPEFQYRERSLPSFQQGFHTVFNQDFNDVGGLYDAFDTFQQDDDTVDEDLARVEPESILPDDVPCSTTDANSMTVVPTNIIEEEPPLITTTVVQQIRSNKPVQQTTVVSSTNEPQIHKCLDCDKTFNKACYLTQHNKSFHSGDKPFKCSRCGKRFTQEIHHLEHLSKHGGDKPHKCEMCPKQFNHKTDLRRHMCLHSGDKPFACDYCGKGFIRKDHMLKHAETHKRKQQQQTVLQQRTVFKKHAQHRLLLDSNMNATTLQVQ